MMKFILAVGAWMLLSLWWFGFLYAAQEGKRWLALAMLGLAAMMAVALAVREEKRHRAHAALRLRSGSIQGKPELRRRRG